MELMQTVVMLSAILCSLVAGMVLTFEILVMPGTRTLGDLEFLKAFRAIDRVIQNNHPIFILIWLGSALVLLAATVMGFWALEGLDFALLAGACAIYILGLQIPTVRINVPLNNRLQAMDLETASDTELKEILAEYDSTWLRWNLIRTVVALITTALLLLLLLRM